MAKGWHKAPQPKNQWRGQKNYTGGSAKTSGGASMTKPKGTSANKGGKGC